MIEYTRIYHLSDSDLDGYGSQYMTKQLTIINNMEIYYYNTIYSEIAGYVSKILAEIYQNRNGKILFLITDLSIEKKVAKKINNFIRGNKDIDLEIKVLDHHISNKEVSDDNKWYYVDNNKCGASITADFVCDFILNDSVRKHLLYVGKLIEAHDNWQENSPFFNKANLLADLINSFNFPSNMKEERRNFLLNYIYSYTSEVQELKTSMEVELFLPLILNKAIFLSNNQSFNVTDDKPSRHKFYEFIAKKYYNENVYKFKNKEVNYTFQIIFDMDRECFQYFSHSYLERRKDIDFIINVRPSGSCGLRSVKDDINVNLVASTVANGGGHFHAAGMKFKFLKKVYSENEAIMEFKKNECIVS